MATRQAYFSVAKKLNTIDPGGVAFIFEREYKANV